MKVLKAGTILLDLENKQIGLVYRDKFNDYSFPKGHLEEGETLKECAVRETEEETGYTNYLLTDVVALLEYKTPNNLDVECHFYIASSYGVTTKFIKDEDKENLVWVSYDDVLNYLSYTNLKDLWNSVKDKVKEIFDNKDKYKYFSFTLNTKNAFFVKPYNFNYNLVNEEDLNRQKEVVKDILKIDRMALVRQMHTSNIKKVTLDNIDEETIADGMVTNLKGVGLATKVADCQAIFLYDPVNKVIGNVHSGWRGTVLKIVKNAIDMMVNDYKSDVKNIKVVICPSIDKCHFEVDLDCYLEFKNSLNEIDIDKYVEYKESINKYYIDTLNLNKDYLIFLGLIEENITLSSMCTVCNSSIMHSYRASKENSGRNLAIIAL